MKIQGLDEGNKDMGELPIWLPLVLSLAFAFTIDGKVKKLRKK